MKPKITPETVIPETPVGEATTRDTPKPGGFIQPRMQHFRDDDLVN